MEAKSAQLTYCPSNRRWLFTFASVKGYLFDLCLLVCYTPHGLYIGEWNGQKLQKRGVSTHLIGGNIRVSGAAHQDWEQALEIIMRDKFPGVIRAFMPWTG